MRKLLVPILLTAAVLMIPIVPFALFGDALEPRMVDWLDAAASPAAVAGLVVGLLAVDIFLPVPSSVVSTFAGSQLGLLGGAAASWLGMTLGAAIAFGLARGFGRPLALRLSSQDDLRRIDELSGRFGPLVLVLARPVPVLAEASVLFLGATRLGWRSFLAAVSLSNLGIAAIYAALGQWVELPIALAAAIALPLLAATIARRFWPAPRDPQQR